jgi:hypothetical protein
MSEPEYPDYCHIYIAITPDNNTVTFLRSTDNFIATVFVELRWLQFAPSS